MDIITLSQGNYTVEVREADEYVNATLLVQQYYNVTGKRRDINHWLSLKRTQESLQHLSSVTGIPVTELVQVKQGGISEEQGTWIHPHISVRFAVWLSDEFGYAVERCFEKLYRKQDNSEQIKQILQRIEALEQKHSTHPQSNPITNVPNFIPPGWDSSVWDELPEQDKQYFRRLHRKRRFIAGNDNLLPGTNELAQYSKENQELVDSFIIPEEKAELDKLKHQLLQIYLNS